MASIPPTSLASASFSFVTPSGPKIFPLSPNRFKSRGAVSVSCSKDDAFAGEIVVPDRIRLAFSKAKAYRKYKMSSPPPAPVNTQKTSMEPTVETQGKGGSEPEVPIAIKLAMEKFKENKKNKQVSIEDPKDLGKEDQSLRNSRNGWVESKLNKKVELKISSKDFVGLGFSEKKSYTGKPPGLVPLVGTFLEGDVPEVEIIVGDASKFEKTARASTLFESVDNTTLYKPKVSTWGVFPRPNNISKTVLEVEELSESGELLETPEAKEAKEKRSRELISAYKKKFGFSIDAVTRAECEKALKDGDCLMDQGQLRGALPYYEKILKSLPFQSNLHGLAALQWSICQDSLSRTNEARIMYEMLKSHPNAEVSKKARQFLFSFQAMEMMKVKHTSLPIKTGYEDYFEAFVDNKPSYTPSIEEHNEKVFEQVFPYLIFLLSPMLIFLFVVVKNSF